MVLETHIEKMTSKYGPAWLEQLDSMEELKSDMSEKAQKTPTLDDVEELFHKSLRRDGKFDQFVLSRAKTISKNKMKKSQNRPNSSGGSKTSSNKGKGGAKTIFEAGQRALAKMKN